MEDPSSAISHAVAPMTRCRLPEPEQHLKCPRCESTNTKFCYYNNYNLSQPRHFCKDCRRYWTKGGTLRNIPVGGGTRRAFTRRSSLTSSPSTAANDKSASCGLKRPSTSPTTSPSSNAARRVLNPEPIPGTCPSPAEACHMLELSGPISPLLTANGMFGELLFNVSHPGGPSAAARAIPDSGFMGWDLFHPPPPAPQQQQQSQTSGDDCNGSEGVTPVVENFLGLVGDSSCWSNISNGGDGWPDLAIYAPGSNFQ